jgi:arginyl-tRNA--protein-N-Asp/Glu arginylyltransferase
VSEYDWIILDYKYKPNRMMCKRCWKVRDVPQGFIPLDEMVKLCEEFMRLHKECKER